MRSQTETLRVEQACTFGSADARLTPLGWAAAETLGEVRRVFAFIPIDSEGEGRLLLVPEKKGEIHQGIIQPVPATTYAVRRRWSGPEATSRLLRSCSAATATTSACRSMAKASS